MNSTNGFVRTSKAWYADTALDGCEERVILSKYLGDQAIGAEITLEWSGRTPGPELRVMSDAFGNLIKDFAGVLRHTSQLAGPVTPDAFCGLLQRLGYTDRTEREQPTQDGKVARLHSRVRPMVTPVS